MKAAFCTLLALGLALCVYANSSAEHGKLGSRGRRSTTCNCGWRKHPMNRIVGGSQSGVNEWPMMAGLLEVQNGGGRQFCGSTIITRRHVVSAAHCFRSEDPYTKRQVDKNPANLRVLIGGHDWTKAPASNFLRVASFIIHEQYNHVTIQNDVAIAQVQGIIPYSEIVGPACFPHSRLSVHQNTVMAVGWGLTSWFGGSIGTSTTVLKKAHLTAYDVDTCANLMRGAFNTGYRHQLCTYNPGTSVCPGDSGGPLLWHDPEINRYVLVGISSFVPSVREGTQGCTGLSGFVDTSAFISWVRSKIGSETLCQKV